MGNIRTLLCAWLSIRARGGRLVLRSEDLDRERVLPDVETNILRDLRALGLDWDEGPDVGGPYGPYRQSERRDRYTDALARLRKGGYIFECACSRADVARAQSAPHPGEEGPRYPGTCRGLAPGEAARRARAHGREPVLRFFGEGQPITFTDAVFGPQTFILDDFVVARADGLPAYQLAAAVDDAAMDITEVVRGADLLPSTARQLALLRALDAKPPTYAHVALVLSSDGERLAKRARPPSLDELTRRGFSHRALIGLLGASLGLCPSGTETTPEKLVSTFVLDRLPRTPWVPPQELQPTSRDTSGAR